MIFVANTYKFGTQWPNSRHVFLPTNKTFEGINCLVLAGEISSERVMTSFCIWNHSVKKNYKSIVLSLFMNMSVKVARLDFLAAIPPKFEH